MDNPLSKIIKEGKKEFEEIFPEERFLTDEMHWEMKAYISKKNVALLQGFLTEIGEDELCEDFDAEDGDCGACCYCKINQTKARLRKVVEGAINNLNK